MMEQAQRQRQGLPIEEEAPARKPKPKPKPAAPKKPQTRQELSQIMSKLIAANPNEAAPKTESMLRYGISRSKQQPGSARPAPRPSAPPPAPKVADAGYSYNDFQQLLKGDGKSVSLRLPLSSPLEN